MDKNKILEKFDELISEAKTIDIERKKNIDSSGKSIISPVGYYRLLSSTKILFSYLKSDIYIELLEREKTFDVVYPGLIQGILESAKREFQFGIISHPKILATADSMEELLEQAEYLLEQDYKDAACVLIGGIFEEVLRSSIKNKYHNIPYNPRDGLRKFNEKLHKESAYDKATFKLIDGYAEIRNSAAHGNYNNYTKEQVEEFLLFTRNFISNWFAIKINIT